MVPWISSLSTLPDSSWFYWKLLFLKFKTCKFHRAESWKSTKAELSMGRMFCRLDCVKVFSPYRIFLSQFQVKLVWEVDRSTLSAWFAVSHRQKQQERKYACLHKIGFRLNHQLHLRLGNKLSSEILESHSQYSQESYACFRKNLEEMLQNA